MIGDVMGLSWRWYRRRSLHGAVDRASNKLFGTGTVAADQRYLARISTVDSLPRRSKLLSSQACAVARPVSRNSQRKPQSALSLLATLSFDISSSAEMLWMFIFFSASIFTMSASIRSVTKLIARISRMRDELKLISLIRLSISEAERGSSVRSIGLM